MCFPAAHAFTPLQVESEQGSHTIRFVRETDGGWTADVPGLPGVTVYGATRERAAIMVETLALRVIAEGTEDGELRWENDGLQLPLAA